MNIASGSVRWRVSGQVQGVGFRWFVRQNALRRGLRGDVRNLTDGRVEIRAAGDAQDLEGLLEAVRSGPPGSRVEDVEVLTPEGPLDEGFEIRR